MAALEQSLADPTLYEHDRPTFDAAASRLENLRADLARAEERWLALETLREERERATDR